jgi:PAS domain S-box-containing protein
MAAKRKAPSRDPAGGPGPKPPTAEVTPRPTPPAPDPPAGDDGAPRFLEELSTVNDQLRDKVAELEAAGNDMANLLTGSDVATIFLDESFRIRRFTPAATRLFHLVATDVDQPIRDIIPRFTDADLLPDVERALRDLVSPEKQVQAEGGRWYTRRVLPYRTRDNRIEGVVVTFADVTALKTAEAALRKLNDALEQRVTERTAALQAANRQLQAEIAEREQAQEQSRRLAAIVESSDDAIIGKTLDGVIVSWNAGAERMYGYSAAEAVGQPISMLAPPDLPDEIPAIMERLKQGEPIAHFKTRRVRKDGERIIVSVSISPVKDRAGKIIGASAIAHDITVQERLEETLRLQGVITVNMAEGVALVRARDAVIVYCNDRYAQMFGYGPGELLGRHVSVLNAPGEKSPEATADEIIGVLRSAKVWRGEVHNIRKDGTTFWASYSVSTFEHPEHGTVWLGVQSNITERKRAEEALLENRERLGAIVNTALDAIITIDSEGIIDSVNPATEKLFGYTAAEMIGQNVTMLMPSPYKEEHDEQIARYVRTGEKHIIGIRREVQGQSKDGRIIPTDLAVNEFHVKGRRMFIGIHHDLRARKQLEREVLEAATAEQRAIGQALHDSTGQELTALELLAATLAETVANQSPAAAGLAAKVSQGLQRVHNQVRGYARGLVPVEVDSRGLSAALEEMASRTSGVSGVTCTFHCPEPVEIDDPQVARNLYHIAQEAVGNALRHARPRNIAIQLDGDDHAVTLRVTDDGSGFPESVGSKGIGLKIMHYRAGLINAHLTIERAEPTGTLVTCTLRKGASYGQKQGDPQ